MTPNRLEHHERIAQAYWGGRTIAAAESIMELIAEVRRLQNKDRILTPKEARGDNES